MKISNVFFFIGIISLVGAVWTITYRVQLILTALICLTVFFLIRWLK